MVKVYFKEAIDDSQEWEFENADDAFISDDNQFLMLTEQGDDDIVPKIRGRIFLTNIIGYYIPY